MTCFIITPNRITTTLEDAIKASPAGTTSLYIHSRVYDALTVADIKAGFRAIPSPINQINIDGLYSDSDGRFRDKINEIYAALPSTITSVTLVRFGELQGLNDDNIGAITGVIKNLPRTIKRLSFSGSNLGKNSVQYIRLLFQALPEGIFELELDGCSLDQLNPTDLTAAFLALPNHLRMLELGLDELGQREESDRKKIFLALPLSVLASLTSEYSSTFNLFLVELLETFVDEVKAGLSSETKMMSDIQRKAIDLRQSGLSDDKRDLIRRELSLLDLKKQLFSYSCDQAKSSEYFLADWLQSKHCMIENKQELAVWSLYVRLSTQCSYRTSPIDFIALAELDFDNPTRFCAFLLWVLRDSDISESGLMEHFFAYHMPFLAMKDSALHEVYRILNQFSKLLPVKRLLDYANNTYSGLFGAKVNYKLTLTSGEDTWQSSNLSGGDFEHSNTFEVVRGELSELPSPELPENPDDIVKLYRWFGVGMLKHLDYDCAEHVDGFKLILMRDKEEEVLVQAIADFMLKEHITPEIGLGWINVMVGALSETQNDISFWIAKNPFYLYAICVDASIINQLSAEQREQSILALQSQISQAEVNSVSIILWAGLYAQFKASHAFPPVQITAINEFILNQALRYPCELPDDVYFPIKETLDISEHFMLDKLNLFKQELLTSFPFSHFETCKFKWGELRAKVYNLLHLCPTLHNDSHYPVNIYEFKAFCIEETWRQSGDQFDLGSALRLIGAVYEDEDPINKRVVLEALLFTREAELQAIFIQYLGNHHIDWVNEKFGDEQFLLEKSILRKNANLIFCILNSLEDDPTTQAKASGGFHHELQKRIDSALLQSNVRGAVYTILFDATLMGQLNIIKHVVHLSAKNKPDRADVSNVLCIAKDSGNWAVVKYFLSLTGSNRPALPTVICILKAALKANNQEIVACCLGLRGDNSLSVHDVLSLFFDAVARGDALIIPHLLSITGNCKLSRENIVRGFSQAAAAGHLHIVSLFIELTWDTLSCDDVSEALSAAIDVGKWQVVAYLYDFRKTMPVDDLVAAYNDNPHILKSFEPRFAKYLLTTSILPGSAFRYLSNAAKNDPEIICAVYNEDPDLLLPGLSNKWFRLFNSIDRMRIYGEYLLEEDAEKGNVCIELAATLKSQAFTMVKSKHDASILEQSTLIFADILTSNKKEMSVYRINVDTLIKNIIIAVISLPILCLPILVQLLYSYHNENRFLFFGQSSKTTREEKLEHIQACLEEAEEEYDVSASA